MFVKCCWRTYKGRRYQHFYLAESFRDPITGTPRHRLLMNLTPLPPHVIEAIRRSLKEGRAGAGSVRVGDALAGAGSLAVDYAWQEAQMDALLPGLTPEQRALARVVVGRRILRPDDEWTTRQPGRVGRVRGDPAGLMDALGRSGVAAVLNERHAGSAAALLGLYRVPVGYGDRGVVGLVFDRTGIPLAGEVWSEPEWTAVLEHAGELGDRFAGPRVVLVGGEPGEPAGMDYVVEARRWREGVRRVEAFCGGPGRRWLETSLPAQEYPSSLVEQVYRALGRVRTNFTGCAPGEVRGCTVLSLLACYLLRLIELEMVRRGEKRPGETVLREWDRLRLMELSCETGGEVRVDWQWALGREGRDIRDCLVKMGWWSAIDQAARRVAELARQG